MTMTRLGHSCREFWTMLKISHCCFWCGNETCCGIVLSGRVTNQSIQRTSQGRFPLLFFCFKISLVPCSMEVMVPLLVTDNYKVKKSRPQANFLCLLSSYQVVKTAYFWVTLLCELYWLCFKNVHLILSVTGLRKFSGTGMVVINMAHTIVGHNLRGGPDSKAMAASVSRSVVSEHVWEALNCGLMVWLSGWPKSEPHTKTARESYPWCGVDQWHFVLLWLGAWYLCQIYLRSWNPTPRLVERCHLCGYQGKWRISV